MSIKALIDSIDEVNLAEKLDKQTLTKMGERVKRQYEEDLDSMESWLESVREGIDLMEVEWHTKSTPWEGASNYKDPLLTEAAITFGDKASLELLQKKDLISADIIGADPEGQKKARIERVTTGMNYQINYGMNDWRTHQERLLYIIANTGCAFKKTIYDPVKRRPESYVIQYPDFVVNQATTDMETCRSFSQILDYSLDKIETKVRLGHWLEIDYVKFKPDEAEGDEGSNEEEGVLKAIDNPNHFIEQQTFFDIDEDGLEEPYIITIHAASGQVVRVVPRFDEESIKVRYQGEVMSVREAIQAEEDRIGGMFGGLEGFSLLGFTRPDPKWERMELVEIVAFQHLTKYGFIPNPDGTFLDKGYAHLVGAMVQSINATTNQLHDTGTLRNIGGGLLSKEFRKDMGINRLKQGTYIKTEVPAAKLAQGIFPNPTQEPSQVLLALNENMKERADRLLATADISGQVTAQTAPTTALAIIQESMITTSALFKRVMDAESKEFQILFKINQRTFSQEEYEKILDEPANVREDFNTDAMDIKPTGNPEMSSKMHKIQVASLEMDAFDRVLQAGGNPIPIVRNYFEAIGSSLTDEVFPEAGAMTPEEEVQVAQMREAQDLANQIQQMQLELLGREQDRLDAETNIKVQKALPEIEKLKADIIDTLMGAAERAEKAESESIKNQIDTYSSQLDVLSKELEAIGALNVRPITESTAFQPRPTGNNPRRLQ